MQHSILFSSLMALAGVASCVALPNPTIDVNLQRRDNCTQYTSVSAGSVCYHQPSDCTAQYLVQSGDTCTSIAAQFNNFTLSQLYYWNPDIGETCLGLRAFVPVCINTPWYTFTPPIQSPDGSVVPASALPVPIMPAITSNCTTFELVGAGSAYNVANIVAANGITKGDFLNWNPYIVGNATTAWDGYWVCVGVS